jgi:NAD(P)-dependent dehydrogenase (short-subunit alcohol dehydrogenase family)
VTQDRGIDLTGTRALVTGGTSGLGLAMAGALARAGAAVAVTSRSAERAAEVAATIPGATGIAADARDEADVARAVAQAWSRLGGIDLLVNNAGLGMITVNPRFMTEPMGFWEVPPAGFRAVLDTNLTGYFLMAREVVPRMLAAGSGRIVNISMNHATMNRRGFVPYGPARPGPGPRHCPGSWRRTCASRWCGSIFCCPAVPPRPACCRQAPAARTGSASSTRP